VSLFIGRKLQDLRPPSEQIAGFLIDNMRQATVDVELFDSDLLEPYGIVGFMEHESTKTGIAIFERINPSSVRLVKCSFSEGLLKRATDVYVYYHSRTTEDDKLERFLLVLNNNPKLSKILANYDNANEPITIETHSAPSIHLISIPDSTPGFIYTFYDAQGNEIKQ
jgi:hypothetical protein